MCQAPALAPSVAARAWKQSRLEHVTSRKGEAGKRRSAPGAATCSSADGQPAREVFITCMQCRGAGAALGGTQTETRHGVLSCGPRGPRAAARRSISIAPCWGRQSQLQRHAPREAGGEVAGDPPVHDEVLVEHHQEAHCAAEHERLERLDRAERGRRLAALPVRLGLLVLEPNRIDRALVAIGAAADVGRRGRRVGREAARRAGRVILDGSDVEDLRAATGGQSCGRQGVR